MSLSPSLLSLCLPDAVSSFQTATDDYKDAPSPFARRAEDEDIDVSQRSGEGGRWWRVFNGCVSVDIRAN